MKYTHKQAGYTLIELILYIALVGILLGAVTSYFGVVLTARVKTETIAEVEQQGQLIMESLAQSVRNSNYIGAPYPGASAPRLTLDVSTAALNPTIFNLTGSTASTFGYNVVGTSTDTNNFNTANATRFTASASGTISTLYANIGATIAGSPNNKARMAIYSGAANPTTLLASSSEVTLTANVWNAFPIPDVAVTSGTVYWLAYNTNGLTAAQNNLKFHTGATGQSRWVAQAYGAWPATITTNSNTREFSLYALIETNAATGAMQIQEGPAVAVALNNSHVQLSSLTFTNLSRSGTPGVVRIRFTLSRVSGSLLNEFEYSKTFTTSVAVRH